MVGCALLEVSLGIAYSLPCDVWPEDCGEEPWDAEPDDPLLTSGGGGPVFYYYPALDFLSRQLTWMF